MLAICKGKDWATTDPLGLGGLLCDAYRVYSLIKEGGFPASGELLTIILRACDQGLNDYTHNR